MKRRHFLLLLVVAAPGVVLFATSPAPSAAAEDGGSGFQSMALTATAGGLQVNGDKLAGQPSGSAATGVPYTSAQLSGSTSHATSSVAWPGTLAANAGSLLLLLGPNPCVPSDDPVTHQPIPVIGGFCDEAAPIPQPVIDNYHYLNDPVRAEALYPGTPHASQGVAGVTMTADSGPDTASSLAELGGGLTTDGLSFGAVTSKVELLANGPTSAVDRATSSAHHVSVAGGVVTIDDVTSSAVTTTTGQRGTATGGTTVSGVRVAGQPVAVDGKGLHVAGHDGDTAAATAAVQTALSSAGVQLYLTPSSRLVQGGSARFHAGSLVILWDVDQAGPKDDVVIALGGADSSSIATLPYPFTPAVLPGSAPGGTPAIDLPSGQVAPPTMGLSLGAPPGVPGPQVGQPSGPGAVLGFDRISFGRPLGAAWLLLLLLTAAALTAMGGRFPARLLAPAESSRCLIEEDERAQA